MGGEGGKGRERERERERGRERGRERERERERKDTCVKGEGKDETGDSGGRGGII